MIQATTNIIQKLIIMFGYSSGLRMNEIISVKLSDIDRETNAAECEPIKRTEGLLH